MECHLRNVSIACREQRRFRSYHLTDQVIVLRKVYFNPKTNETWKFGDTIYNLELANTYEKLATSPDFVYEFYEGSIGRELVEKIESMGGILTREDLLNYTPAWETPTHWTMRGTYDVYSPSQYFHPLNDSHEIPLNPSPFREILFFHSFKSILDVLQRRFIEFEVFSLLDPHRPSWQWTNSGSDVEHARLIQHQRIQGRFSILSKAHGDFQILVCAEISPR